jgi:hypothetical protein
LRRLSRPDLGFLDPQNVFVDDEYVIGLRRNHIEQHRASEPWLLRAVVLTSTREAVGTIGFHGPPDACGMVEIGGRNGPATSVCSSEPLVVQIVHPTIATTPSPTSLTLGNGASVNDTATISNGYFPNGGIAPGNVTFKLYGPFTSAANIVCTANPATFTDTEAAARVNDSTASATSASFTPTQVGVYQWVASYAGNAQNAPASTGCNDPTEQVTVNPATPTVASTILLSDKAKVTGVSGAGDVAGTAQFQLYPTADCSGTTVPHNETVTLAGDGTAATQSSTPANAAGTYSWKVTFTPAAGSNYTGASTTCTAAQSDEQATISYAGTSPIPNS